MKRSRCTEDQIVGIFKEHRAGVSVADLRRKHGVRDATVYKSKAKQGGMDVSEAKRLKRLEDENARLKQLTARGDAPPSSRTQPSPAHEWRGNRRPG